MVFASYADPMTLHSLSPPYAPGTGTPSSIQQMRKNSDLHYHSTSLYVRSTSESGKPASLPPKSFKYYNSAPRGSLQYYNMPPGTNSAKSFFDAMYNNDYGNDEQVPVYDRLPRNDGPIYQIPRSGADSGVEVDPLRMSTSSEIKQSVYNEDPQYSTFNRRSKNQSQSSC